jgi:hypothetical protein
MSPDLITLSPEVEEVLRDVARRPGSGLLRVQRKDVLRAVVAGDSLVRATSAGLSSAERQLLQVHREEVAYALRAASYHRLVHGPDAPEFLADRAIHKLARAVPSQLDVQRAVTGALEVERGGVESGSSVLLRACLGRERAAWPRVDTLAAAAHRLVPTDASRIYVGLEMRRIGQPFAALVAYRSVIHVGGALSTQVAAWTNIGDLLFAQGKIEDASRAAGRASALDASTLCAHVSQAVCAILINRSAQVQKCVETLEEVMLQRPDGLHELLALRAQHPAMLTVQQRMMVRHAMHAQSFSRYLSAKEALDAIIAP